MDKGFVDAGFVPIRSFDSNLEAISVLKENVHKDAAVYDLSNWDSTITDCVSRADMLIAGPPCQGFSTAGKNNPNDVRNDHLSNVARIAAVALPKIVVIENVRGVLNPKNSDHLNNTLGILSSAGYQVSYDTYDASDCGVAQSRKRVFIIGTLTEKKHSLSLKCAERVSLRDILPTNCQESISAGKFLKKGSEEYKIAKRIPPGHKLSNVRRSLVSVHTWEIPEVFGKVSKQEISLLETIVKLRRQKRRRPNGDADPVDEEYLKQLFGDEVVGMIDSLVTRKYLRKDGGFVDITNTFNGKFRRLKWDDISPTVHTRFGQPRYFLHPSEHRGFSVKEAALIQSFPDNFRFSGSETSQFRMIGNAVPPKLAEAVANEISRLWNNL